MSDTKSRCCSPTAASPAMPLLRSIYRTAFRDWRHPGSPLALAFSRPQSQSAPQCNAPCRSSDSVALVPSGTRPDSRSPQIASRLVLGNKTEPLRLSIFLQHPCIRRSSQAIPPPALCVCSRRPSAPTLPAPRHRRRTFRLPPSTKSRSCVQFSSPQFPPALFESSLPLHHRSFPPATAISPAWLLFPSGRTQRIHHSIDELSTRRTCSKTSPALGRSRDRKSTRLN